MIIYEKECFKHFISQLVQWPKYKKATVVKVLNPILDIIMYIRELRHSVKNSAFFCLSNFREINVGGCKNSKMSFLQFQGL